MVVVAAGASLAWLIASKIIFHVDDGLAYGKSRSPSAGAIYAVAVAAVIILKLLNNKFAPYEFMRGAEKSYDSPLDRRMVILYYWLGIAIIILSGASAHFIGRFVRVG